RSTLFPYTTLFRSVQPNGLFEVGPRERRVPGEDAREPPLFEQGRQQWGCAGTVRIDLVRPRERRDRLVPLPRRLERSRDAQPDEGRIGMLPGGRLRVPHRSGVAPLDLPEDEVHVLVLGAIPEARRPQRDRREESRRSRSGPEARAPGPPRLREPHDGGAPERRESHEEREAVPRRDEEGRDGENVRRDESRPDEEGAARRASRPEERENEPRARERHEEPGPDDEELEREA